jgi:hypothetical protein
MPFTITAAPVSTQPAFEDTLPPPTLPGVFTPAPASGVEVDTVQQAEAATENIHDAPPLDPNPAVQVAESAPVEQPAPEQVPLDATPIADEVPAVAAPDPLDLSALFAGMEIDTSEPEEPEPSPEPRPDPQREPPPAPTIGVQPQVQQQPAVMPMTIKPSGPARWPAPTTQAREQSPEEAAASAVQDSMAWKTFAGLAAPADAPTEPQVPYGNPSQNQGQPQQGYNSPSPTPQPQPQPYPQPQPQQPQAPLWQPGQPRPQPGTPEYDAMVQAALAQRGINTGPPTSQQPAYQPVPQPQPQPQPYQQPQSGPPAWQPGQPRPKPGTPEYEAMVQAALAQRGMSGGQQQAYNQPPPQQPYNPQPTYNPPPPQSGPPAWQPGQPRPQPGTPEYDEMVRAALAQRGVSSTPPPTAPQNDQAPAWQPGQPRPKPGTPEYDEMVRRALEERRRREGR